MASVAEWSAVRAVLNKAFLRAGITYCEVRLPGCWMTPQGHAHKKKRRNLTPEELWVTCLACNSCHQQLEIMPEAKMGEVIQGIIDARESVVKIR